MVAAGCLATLGTAAFAKHTKIKYFKYEGSVCKKYTAEVSKEKKIVTVIDEVIVDEKKCEGLADEFHAKIKRGWKGMLPGQSSYRIETMTDPKGSEHYGFIWVEMSSGKSSRSDASHDEPCSCGPIVHPDHHARAQGGSKPSSSDEQPMAAQQPAVGMIPGEDDQAEGAHHHHGSHHHQGSHHHAERHEQHHAQEQGQPAPIAHEQAEGHHHHHHDAATDAQAHPMAPMDQGMVMDHSAPAHHHG